MVKKKLAVAYALPLVLIVMALALFSFQEGDTDMLTGAVSTDDVGGETTGSSAGFFANLFGTSSNSGTDSSVTSLSEPEPTGFFGGLFKVASSFFGILADDSGCEFGSPDGICNPGIESDQICQSDCLPCVNDGDCTDPNNPSCFNNIFCVPSGPPSSYQSSFFENFNSGFNSSLFNLVESGLSVTQSDGVLTVNGTSSSPNDFGIILTNQIIEMANFNVSVDVMRDFSSVPPGEYVSAGFSISNQGNITDCVIQKNDGGDILKLNIDGVSSNRQAESNGTLFMSYDSATNDVLCVLVGAQNGTIYDLTAQQTNFQETQMSLGVGAGVGASAIYHFDNLVFNANNAGSELQTLSNPFNDGVFNDEESWTKSDGNGILADNTNFSLHFRGTANSSTSAFMRTNYVIGATPVLVSVDVDLSNHISGSSELIFVSEDLTPIGGCLVQLDQVCADKYDGPPDAADCIGISGLNSFNLQLQLSQDDVITCQVRDGETIIGEKSVQDTLPPGTQQIQFSGSGTAGNQINVIYDNFHYEKLGSSADDSGCEFSSPDGVCNTVFGEDENVCMSDCTPCANDGDCFGNDVCNLGTGYCEGSQMLSSFSEPFNGMLMNGTLFNPVDSNPSGNLTMAQNDKGIVGGTSIGNNDWVSLSTNQNLDTSQLVNGAVDVTLNGDMPSGGIHFQTILTNNGTYGCELIKFSDGQHQVCAKNKTFFNCQNVATGNGQLNFSIDPATKTISCNFGGSYTNIVESSIEPRLLTLQVVAEQAGTTPNITFDNLVLSYGGGQGGCSVDQDCTEPGLPYCNVGTCEQCLLDEHCGGGQVCTDYNCVDEGGPSPPAPSTVTDPSAWAFDGDGAPDSNTFSFGNNAQGIAQPARVSGYLEMSGPATGPSANSYIFTKNNVHIGTQFEYTTLLDLSSSGGNEYLYGGLIKQDPYSVATGFRVSKTQFCAYNSNGTQDCRDLTSTPLNSAATVVCTWNSPLMSCSLNDGSNPVINTQVNFAPSGDYRLGYHTEAKAAGDVSVKIDSVNYQTVAGCTEHTDCNTDIASRCNGGTCDSCLDDSHCTHIAGKPTCDTGVCVEGAPGGGPLTYFFDDFSSRHSRWVDIGDANGISRNVVDGQLKFVGTQVSGMYLGYETDVNVVNSGFHGSFDYNFVQPKGILRVGTKTSDPGNNGYFIELDTGNNNYRTFANGVASATSNNLPNSGTAQFSYDRANKQFSIKVGESEVITATGSTELEEMPLQISFIGAGNGQDHDLVIDNFMFNDSAKQLAGAPAPPPPPAQNSGFWGFPGTTINNEDWTSSNNGQQVTVSQNDKIIFGGVTNYIGGSASIRSNYIINPGTNFTGSFDIDLTSDAGDTNYFVGLFDDSMDPKIACRVSKDDIGVWHPASPHIIDNGDGGSNILKINLSLGGEGNSAEDFFCDSSQGSTSGTISNFTAPLYLGLKAVSKSNQGSSIAGTIDNFNLSINPGGQGGDPNSCSVNGDCNSPSASFCNAQNQCSPCGDDSACNHIGQGFTCNAGVCQDSAPPPPGPSCNNNSICEEGETPEGCANDCTGCNENTECTGASLPQCNNHTNQCEGCVNDGHCSNFPGTACLNHACREYLTSFTDNFNDGTINSTLYTQNLGGYGTIEETSGYLKLTGMPSSPGSFMGVNLINPINLNQPFIIQTGVDISNSGLVSTANLVVGDGGANPMNLMIRTDDVLRMRSDGTVQKALEYANSNPDTLTFIYNPETKKIFGEYSGTYTNGTYTNAPSSGQLSITANGQPNISEDVRYDNLNFISNANCLDSARHCELDTKSKCDVGSNLCVACTDNNDCTHIDGKPTCDAGTCVAEGSPPPPQNMMGLFDEFDDVSLNPTLWTLDNTDSEISAGVGDGRFRYNGTTSVESARATLTSTYTYEDGSNVNAELRSTILLSGDVRFGFNTLAGGVQAAYCSIYSAGVIACGVNGCDSTENNGVKMDQFVSMELIVDGDTPVIRCGSPDENGFVDWSEAEVDPAQLTGDVFEILFTTIPTIGSGVDSRIRSVNLWTLNGDNQCVTNDDCEVGSICDPEGYCMNFGDAVCGDNRCEFPEDQYNCNLDCGGFSNCGNGRIDPGENYFSCPQDMDGFYSVCGDGMCSGSETSATCSQDCGGDLSNCGDGFCGWGEHPDNCPIDCGNMETDFFLEGDFAGGLRDFCGDFECNMEAGENVETCAYDCGHKGECYMMDGDQSACEADSDCNWNNNFKLCDPLGITCGESCGECLSQAQCLGSPKLNPDGNKACVWDTSGDGFCREDFTNFQPGIWTAASNVGNNWFDVEPVDCRVNPQFCDGRFNQDFDMVEKEYSCYNGVDDDSDTFSDCDDPDCWMTQECQGTYDSGSDTTAPSILHQNVDPFDTGVDIFIMTSEPVGLSIYLYEVGDNDCSESYDTVERWDDPNNPYDDYMVDNGVMIDGFNYVDLSPSTLYNYKAHLVDPAGNEMTTKCKNFTTLDAPNEKQFGFGRPIQFDWDGDGSFEDVSASGNLSKVGSAFRGVNAFVPLQFERISGVNFKGMDIASAGTFDLSNAFSEVNEMPFRNLKGFSFNSQIWNQLNQHNTPDGVEISVLGSIEDCDSIQRCSDENICRDVTSQITSCVADPSNPTTNILVEIPPTLGFSTYVFGANSELTIGDNTDDTTVYPDGNVVFYANYTDSNTSLALTPSGDNSTCNITIAAKSVTNTPMTFNLSADDRWSYTTTFSSAGDYPFSINCTASGYTSLNAAENATVTANPGGEEVPEFSDYAIALLLMTVAGGFIYMRKKEAEEHN